MNSWDLKNAEKDAADYEKKRKEFSKSTDKKDKGAVTIYKDGNGDKFYFVKGLRVYKDKSKQWDPWDAYKLKYQAPTLDGKGYIYKTKEGTLTISATGKGVFTKDGLDYTSWEKENKKKKEEKKKNEQKKAEEKAAEEAAKEAEEEKAAAERKESMRSEISAKMAEVANTIKAVSNKFRDNPVYATYLRFSMNNLVIETTSTDNNKNLLMSFTNNKNGSGYANSFSLRIAYAPNVGEDFNINRIDNAIVRGTQVGFEYSSRYCQIQYGYADEMGGELKTVTYNGLVMDYTSEVQDGMLIYDITGYSALVMWNESKKAIAVDKSNAVDGLLQPTKAFRSIVEKYLQTSTDSVTQKPYQLEFDDNVEGSDAPVDLPASLDKNVGKALDDILKKAVLQADYDKLTQDASATNDNPTTYSWFVSDVATSDEYAGTIWVVMYNKEQLKKQNADANLVFNWMSPGADGDINHIVIDFKPEFKGSVLLSQAAKKLNKKLEITGEDGETITPTDEGLYTGSYFTDNDGKLQKCQDTDSPISGGDVSTVVVNTESNNSKFIQELTYPYKASMVTMGIPCEIPITGIIKIVPMIYGQPHFSNGNYMILGNTDEISSNGNFTTSWDLMKIDISVDNTSEETPKKTRIEAAVGDGTFAGDFEARKNYSKLDPVEKMLADTLRNQK